MFFALSDPTRTELREEHERGLPNAFAGLARFISHTP
jgi:hypothetical protein